MDDGNLILFSSSVMSDLCGPSRTTACQASLSFTISQSLLKLMSIESVMPSNHLILCRPLLLLPSVFLSIRGFSSKSVLPFCCKRPLRIFLPQKISIVKHKMSREWVNHSFICSLTAYFFVHIYGHKLCQGPGYSSDR